MAEQAKGPAKATTRRQKAYLDKLESQKGKRVVVDLDPESNACLTALLAVGFADNQTEVIRRSLQESAIRLRKKRA